MAQGFEAANGNSGCVGPSLCGVYTIQPPIALADNYGRHTPTTRAGRRPRSPCTTTCSSSSTGSSQPVRAPSTLVPLLSLFRPSPRRAPPSPRALWGPHRAPSPPAPRSHPSLSACPSPRALLHAKIWCVIKFHLHNHSDILQPLSSSPASNDLIVSSPPPMARKRAASSPEKPSSRRHRKPRNAAIAPPPPNVRGWGEEVSPRPPQARNKKKKGFFFEYLIDSINSYIRWGTPGLQLHGVCVRFEVN